MPHTFIPEINIYVTYTFPQNLMERTYVILKSKLHTELTDGSEITFPDHFFQACLYQPDSCSSREAILRLRARIPILISLIMNRL